MALWTCDQCGRQFARKTWHSCAVYSLDEHFKKASPEVQKAFEKMVTELQNFGPLRVDPVKTSISLFCRIFFASVSVSGKSLQIDFISPEKIDSSRLAKSVFGQRNYYNSIRVRSVNEVDDELLNWLKQAMVLAG